MIIIFDMDIDEYGFKGKMHKFNYYDFDALTHITREQNHIFSKLDYAFFDKLSQFKFNLKLNGLLDKNLTYTPTEFIYFVDKGTIGLYNKKKIISTFEEYGIRLTINYKDNKKKILTDQTIFKIG
jgi:hypothetical protein